MKTAESTADMTAIQRRKIQTQLLQWFKKTARDLPWRRTRDPYAIWISEIMLQQTQVATAIPYYHRFLKSFPTVRHLARADLSSVLKAWEGLGYYSRARNLHRAAQEVVSQFGGEIPDAPDDLLRLPGIGRYTAGAILSIAFNQNAPILDGNVKRVLSRLFAISGNPSKTEKRLWSISGSLLPEGKANAFNQALMELGATLCTPRDPRCLLCPIGNLCRAYALGKPERYPARVVRKPIPHVHGVGGVIQRDGKVLLVRRPPRGLLGGLWEFPNIETENKERLKQALQNYLRRGGIVGVKIGKRIGVFEQTFSHFRLTLHIYSCETTDGKGNGKWFPVKTLDHLAMSRIHRRIADSISDSSS